MITHRMSIIFSSWVKVTFPNCLAFNARFTIPSDPPLSSIVDDLGGLIVQKNGVGDDRLPSAYTCFSAYCPVGWTNGGGHVGCHWSCPFSAGWCFSCWKRNVNNDLLSQWLNFKLFGITYLVGKISRSNFFFQGPLAEWDDVAHFGGWGILTLILTQEMQGTLSDLRGWILNEQRVWENSCTWQFFVTFLKWVSDPFKG